MMKCRKIVVKEVEEAKKMCMVDARHLEVDAMQRSKHTPIRTRTKTTTKKSRTSHIKGRVILIVIIYGVQWRSFGIVLIHYGVQLYSIFPLVFLFVFPFFPLVLFSIAAEETR